MSLPFFCLLSIFGINCLTFSSMISLKCENDSHWVMKWSGLSLGAEHLSHAKSSQKYYFSTFFSTFFYCSTVLLLYCSTFLLFYFSTFLIFFSLLSYFTTFLLLYSSTFILFLLFYLSTFLLFFLSYLSTVERQSRDILETV